MMPTIPPPPSAIGAPPIRRPRMSSTCDGSSLASLRNRMSRRYPPEPDSQPLGSLGVSSSETAFAYASCRFALACSRSRTTASSTPPSRRTGSSARMHSIASLAWGGRAPPGDSPEAERRRRRDRLHDDVGHAYLVERLAELVLRRKSALTTDRLRRAHLLGVDLLERHSVLEALDLPLCSVPLGHGEVRGGADLLGHGQHPLDELLDPLSRGNRLAALEIEQLTGKPVADCAPEVLLDQPVRERPRTGALVVGAGAARRQRGRECRERLRLAELGLAVADADLDGREREMRAHAPPDLRVLGDRSGLVEEADEALVFTPRRERVRNAAAREEAGEDLCPGGVQAGVHVLDEGELADSARSSGRKLRIAAVTAMARSGP